MNGPFSIKLVRAECLSEEYDDWDDEEFEKDIEAALEDYAYDNREED